MQTDVKQTDEASAKVSQMVENLKSRFSNTGAALGRANADLYKDLGRVYEDAEIIGKSTPLRNALVAKVREAPDFPGEAEWNPVNRSDFEKLLVLAMGFNDKASLRSLYLSVLRNAQAEKVAPEEAVLAKWLEDKHGVVAAAKRDGPSSTPQKPIEIIESFLAKTRGTADEDTGEIVQVDFTPPEDSRNLGLFVGELLPGVGWRIILKTGRADLVARVLEETDDELSLKKQLAIGKRAVWELNDVTAKIARAARKNLTADDIKTFTEAVGQLKKQPSLAEKYFDDVPSCEAKEDELGLKVQNAEAPVLDPARYIKHAKVGAIPPVDVSGIKFTAKDDKAKRMTIVDALPGYKTAAPRPLKNASADPAPEVAAA